MNIEKNIPIPTRGEIIPWRAMEIGDSVFIQGDQSDLKKYRNRISSIAQRKKYLRFAVRMMDGGMRVWRIQAKEDVK